MAEGSFPKSDGDIFFASEANRFGGAGRFVEMGSFAAIASGISPQDIGSIVINAGSLSNPAHLWGTLKYTSNARDNITINISGVSKNAFFTGGSQLENGFISFNAVVGSPFPGNIHATTYRGGGGGNYITDNEMMVHDVSLSNLDTTETVVILISGTASAAMGIDSYSIQSFRGAV